MNRDGAQQVKDSAEILSSERSTPARPRDTASSFSDVGAPPQAEGTETPHADLLASLDAVVKDQGRGFYLSVLVKLCERAAAALRGTEAATPAPLETK